MRKTEVLHVFLGLVGIVALALFVLGCVSSISWSPDSSRVAFVYHDPQPDRNGVAIYDRRARTVTSIVTSGEKKSTVMQAQWSNAGDKLLILSCFDSESLQLLILPVAGHASPQQLVPIGSCDDESQVPYLPAPERDGVLYLLGLKSGLAKVTLSTGAVEQIENVDPAMLIPRTGDPLYLLPFERPVPFEPEITNSPQQQETEKVYQFGVFELASNKMKPRFEITPADFERLGLQDLCIWFATEPGGGRFAATALDGHAGAILLFRETGIERAVVPKLPVSQPFWLGTLTWGTNGKLYATVAIRSGEDTALAAIAEFSPDIDSTARLVPLAEIKWSGSVQDRADNFRAYARMSLSPDGTTLAANLAQLALEGDDSLSPETRGLYLVDLRSATRKVTRIPIPTGSEPMPVPAAKSQAQ